MYDLLLLAWLTILEGEDVVTEQGRLGDGGVMYSSSDISSLLVDLSKTTDIWFVVGRAVQFVRGSDQAVDYTGTDLRGSRKRSLGPVSAQCPRDHNVDLFAENGPSTKQENQEKRC